MAKIKLDFTGVQDGFKNVTKAGNYPVKIVKVEPKKSQQGKPYLNWEFEVTMGEFKGAKLWYITSLQKQALFNLRNLLQAAGLDVPKSVVSIDLDTLIGRQVEVEVYMEEYNGKMRPRVDNVSKLDINEGIDGIEDEEIMDFNNVSTDDIDLEGLDL